MISYKLEKLLLYNNYFIISLFLNNKYKASIKFHLAKNNIISILNISSYSSKSKYINNLLKETEIIVKKKFKIEKVQIYDKFNEITVNILKENNYILNNNIMTKFL